MKDKMSGEELIARAKAVGVGALVVLGKDEMSLQEVMDRVMAGETVYPHIPYMENTESGSAQENNNSLTGGNDV